jgi:mono/diheme cytochrome c family protein
MRQRERSRLALAVIAVVLAACGGGGDAPAAAVDPERGAALFDANCAACHGPQASGTTLGPPLVHEVYEPGHHSDEAFQLAVARGSPQHHWTFGPMPAIPGLDRQQVADITAYVRELQREAGIIP